MVGFGSTLRLARRPGWEGAYLDYEALKLLLSHIEAIYEEDGQNSNAWDADMERLHPRSKKKARRKRKNEEPSTVRDYKEALFLESNSDLAYLSVESSDDDETFADEVKDNQENEDLQQPTAQPFTLSSYSQIPEDEHSSGEEDDGDMTSNLCWAGVKNRSSATSTTTNTTANSATKKSRRTRKKGGASSQLSSISDHEADQFYTSSSAYYRTKYPNALQSQSQETSLNSHHQDTTLSNAGLFEESLQYFPSSPHPTEATSLLFSKQQETPPQQKSTLFTFATGGEPLTPPASYMYPHSLDPTTSTAAPLPYNTNFWELYRTPKGAGVNTLQQPPLSHPVKSAARPELPDRTKRERQLRRRQLRLQRRQRATTVPHSLRVAHSKARAITERFLGLLKAETEKVLLFAQSRLGELADTAGSLRFPAFDEEYASNQKNARYPSGQGENYHFGDGLHPSASSSSEEGGSRPPWGSSSSEEDGDDEGLLPSAEDVPTTATRPESDAVLYVRRQIAHFTELRKRRAIFQRSEHIMGEDMLFLSAVEEADGYTAVGVELLHTLKYICVNLIAVRKICRKHDRLLVNRMLGGYYQRLNREPNAYHGSTGVPTLGGMLAHISGDSEQTPSSCFHRNHNGHKLVGVYDQKLQMLANSPTVRVISSCLALSLSEYEMARSRADALTRLNSSTALNKNDAGEGSMSSNVNDEDSMYDPPSTASTVSLTRLRFTVLSVYAFREVSRSKRDCFLTYLSRASLSFTGLPVVGEGLDGCSRETLDFLLSYDPDAALIRDPSLLFVGLQKNRWSRLPMEEVMISTLATATIEMFVSLEVSCTILEREYSVVSHAVSANPDYSQPNFWNKLVNDSTADDRITVQVRIIHNQPQDLLKWSRMSLFLFSLNYFLSHATTASFLKAAGSPASYSAVIIGAPNISALFIALCHCWYGSNETSPGVHSRFSTEALRSFILFGAVMGVLGNAIHGYAINRSSVLFAIVGRFCIGFSSAEILQRDIMSNCGPAHIVAESGRLVFSRITGSVVGLLIGGLSAIPIENVLSGDMVMTHSAHTRRVQFASWLAMLLWLIHLLLILIRSNISGNADKQTIADHTFTEEIKEQDTKNPAVTVSEDSDSVSSSSVDIGTPSSVMFRPLLDAVEPIDNAVSTMERHSEWENANANSPLVRRDDDGQSPFLHRRNLSRHWKTMGRARKLLLFHLAIPISLLVYFFSTFAVEVFFTSTPFITDRYFAWNGEHSGLFLACLSTSYLPLTFAFEIVARRYEERILLKRALTTACWGLFLMVNWQSMFALAELLPSVFAATDGRPRHLYDWKLGVVQYIVGLVVVYSSLVALEGASLSLLSKVSPVNTRSLVVNVGSMATCIGFIARFLGDFQIVMIDLSDMIISMDIVNALVVPLILACFLLLYVIRKHFFILL